MERDFKGVWIPKKIWVSKSLSWIEKLFLVEIDSLSSTDKGCFASNAYFAEFFGLSVSRTRAIIADLKNKGFIDVKILYKEKTKEVDKRFITLTEKLLISLEENEKNDNNKQTPLPENKQTPLPENKQTPLPENKQDIKLNNIKLNNNTHSIQNSYKLKKESPEKEKESMECVNSFSENNFDDEPNAYFHDVREQYNAYGREEPDSVGLVEYRTFYNKLPNHRQLLTHIQECGEKLPSWRNGYAPSLARYIKNQLFLTPVVELLEQENRNLEKRRNAAENDNAEDLQTVYENYRKKWQAIEEQAKNANRRV